MKMTPTGAGTPDAYFGSLDGWRAERADLLRTAVRRAVPSFDERLKWGHAVYFLQGPVLLIRAEPERVLLGFWRGQRLLGIEPRLKGGGKYEMATLVIGSDTSLVPGTIASLAREAARLDARLGDPTAIARPAKKGDR